MADLSVPRATYRLQFHAGFTFEDATRILPYLDDLGISHVYASPYLKARPGSTHGYDITDHNSLNPEIGDTASFDAFCGQLASREMGQVLDFVPNHMGIHHADNGWWLDVLEWGEESVYAEYFDIDWSPAKPELKGKVLVPSLGDHYGRVLVDGQLRLGFDAANGTFGIGYYEHYFPLAPGTYPLILRLVRDSLMKEEGVDQESLAELALVLTGFGELKGAGRSARHRGVRRALADRLKRQLAELVGKAPPIAQHIEGAIANLNGTPGKQKSFVALHRLLEAQHYRLAYWRVAAEEINYRRFFQINDLGGIRMELAGVFDAVHRLVLQWIAEGRVQGLRIDHIDGLFDPRQYLERLQARAREARQDTTADSAASPGDLYVVVEKILAGHETLRTQWPIAGTTGYEFLNRLTRLFVDPAGEERLTRFYDRIAADDPPFHEIAYLGRKLAMDQELASELRVLANEINHMTEESWFSRDFTLVGIRQALREIVACFPVYRTYIDRHGPSPEDRRDIDWAVAHARRRSARADLSVFDFLKDLLTTDLGRGPAREVNRREVLRLAMKFQQYTGAVMAKGLEDTAFYRYNRLISLNEVGGEPTRFGTSVSAFHYACQDVARRWPTTMLSTATHDTKRGEDVRMRINALSELSQEWRTLVRRWAVLNRRHKSLVNDAPAPDNNEEYLFYQTLVGAWPTDCLTDAVLEPGAMDALAERLGAYMLKAAREAKAHSSWINQDVAYEEAVLAFVRQSLDVSQRNLFLESVQPFATKVAAIGAVNSLSETALKLTSPGVPDIYQGCELWDLSLVDPDNRRPVDYDVRRNTLAEIRRRFDVALPAVAIEGLVRDWPSGRIKLFVTWRLLALRRSLPELFRAGGYLPVESEGVNAANLCAFVRHHGDAVVLVVVPRLVSLWVAPEALWPNAETVWGDTRIMLPEGQRPPGIRSVLTGEAIELGPEEMADGKLPVARLLSGFPVGVYVGHTATPSVSPK